MALPVNGSWLTHISGHPSAAGRAQDKESLPARDRRSTTVPRHQPINIQIILTDTFTALTLLVKWQEGHSACKKLSGGGSGMVMSGVRCRRAHGPADATAIHCLLLQ